MLANRLSFKEDETLTNVDTDRLDFFTAAVKGTGLRAYVEED
jgi:hypothetical protein